MPTHRFYLPSDLPIGETVILEDAEHHHLSRVMRMQEGDVAEIINGKGVIAFGMILQIEKKKTSIRIDSSKQILPKLPHFFLAIPLMRPSKLEWIVEKGTELGSSAFLFYTADRSEKDNLSNHQIERLQSLIIAALKQSGRADLPSLEILPNLLSLASKQAIFFFGDPRTEESMILSHPKSELPIIFITGPEAGFSSQEELFLTTHAKKTRLNPHTLRAETAPLAAASLLGWLQCSHQHCTRST